MLCAFSMRLDYVAWESVTDDVEFLAAIVYWHIASFPRVSAICKELAHKIFEGKTALLKDASLPILSENHVLGNQSRS